MVGNVQSLNSCQRFLPWGAKNLATYIKALVLYIKFVHESCVYQATLYNGSGRGWPHGPHSCIARHGAIQINTETVESAALGVASSGHMLVRC